MRINRPPGASKARAPAQDHLKAGLRLGRERPPGRMTHSARQEMYFGRHITLDEIIAGIENATAADVQRVAGELFTQDAVGVTVLGPAGPAALDFTRLAVA